jgi:putative transposase
VGNGQVFARFPPDKKAAPMSIKTYKYRISPNKTTTDKLYRVLNLCRELYNAGLQERRDAYEIKVKRHPNSYDNDIRKQLIREHAISVYGQKRDLVEIKEIRPEYQEIASHVLQDVLFRLEEAFKAFFRRMRNGEKPGYPDFRGAIATTP